MSNLERSNKIVEELRSTLKINCIVYFWFDRTFIRVLSTTKNYVEEDVVKEIRSKPEIYCKDTKQIVVGNFDQLCEKAEEILNEEKIHCPFCKEEAIRNKEREEYSDPPLPGFAFKCSKREDHQFILNNWC